MLSSCVVAALNDEEKGSPWKRSAKDESSSERRPRRPRERGVERFKERGPRPPRGKPPERPGGPASNRRSELGDQRLEPVCGLHAVGSLFYCKPFIVERLFFDAETAPLLGEMCKFLAKEKKVYRQVEAEELAKVAGTRAHGGVVAIARRRPLELATVNTAEYWGKEGMPLLILDGVSNAFDLGSLARTSAFFGVEKFLIAATKQQARPSELAYRVARGGLDMLDVRLVENVPSFLKGIRKSHFTIGLDVEGAPLPELTEICPEEQVDKPVAIVIGHEEMGLSDGAREACEALVAIPGSGALDRLNLVAEVSLLLQKYLVEAS